MVLDFITKEASVLWDVLSIVLSTLVLVILFIAGSRIRDTIGGEAYGSLVFLFILTSLWAGSGALGLISYAFGGVWFLDFGKYLAYGLIMFFIILKAKGFY